MGQRDRAVWDEFAADHARLHREAARIRAAVEPGSTPATRSPEVDAAQRTVEEQAGRRPVGQERQTDPEVRRVVEAHAMELARRHFERQGWVVEDVSGHESYDLHCTRRGGQELRVEAKGTTGDGATVLLTPNEVAHARRQYPRVALFVVAGIQVAAAADGPPHATGGTAHVYDPWRIGHGALIPVGYAYTPPLGS